jgi:pilus assembly protein CpaF
VRVKLASLLDAVSEEARNLALRSSALPAQSLNAAVDFAVEARVEGFSLQDELELRKSAEDRLFGFGALQPLLDDSSIEEIWINGPGLVYVAKSGVSSRMPFNLGDREISGLVERMLRPTGRRLDRSSPFVDASLPDGSRLHVVIPDITRAHWSVNIRKFPQRILTLDDLESLGSITTQQAKFLRDAVIMGQNILVSGATQAGKTTVLCALLAALDVGQRIISVEETFEIRVSGADWVAMQTRQPNLEGVGEVNLRRLIKEALRMRPNRLVVGEVREAEALDLLIALNSGLPGLCTIHANSAEDALAKICTLPLLAGQNISSDFVVPTVASCINLVVHCELNGTGKREVAEILRITGFDGVLQTERVAF